jgi:hypothetical protein
MSDHLFPRSAATDIADPLVNRPAPERVNYATGVMLQADDFLAEQTYHRSRLAQLVRHLLGHGTLAGLRVFAPPPETNLIELRVDPGMAVDRYGRLIEVQSAQCINLGRWFAAQPLERLKTATHNNFAATLDKAVVADVFLSAHACGRGKTPSFASGPFDALDALVAARLAETPRLEMVLRTEGNVDAAQPAPIPNPENFWPKPSGTPAAIAKAQLDAVLGSWDIGLSDAADSSLAPLVEHVPGRDPSAILLARIAIPVIAETLADRTVVTRFDATKKLIVDNSIRPIIFFPGKWFGRSLQPAPTS